MLNFVEIPDPSRFRIGNLFQDNNFIVPQYQRNFAWQDTEMDDFWGDLLELSEGRRSSHFFGQIVTFRNPDGNQELIDGQQRLTSSSILLAVMRDIAMKAYNEHRDEMSPDTGDTLRDIRRDVKKYLRGEGDQPSLILQKGNKDVDGVDANAYFEHLVHQAPKKPYTEPTKNMQAAYVFFKQAIQKHLQAITTWSERVDWLNRTFHAFADNFYVVMISAPTQQDAFIIFETLNSRGKDLKASDIVKNHLMYLANGDMERANGKWNAVSKELKDDSDRITRFIRTYWAARERLVVESHLYRALSSELNTGAQGDEFLDDLMRLVHPYDVLESATAAQRRKYFESPELAHQIDIMSRMRVKLFYPVVLSMTKRGFATRDFIIVMQKIISVFIRHRMIMNEGTNRLEVGYSALAQKIWSGELNSTITISQYLNKHLLKPDAQVKGAFLNLAREGGLRGPKKWIMVYLLTQLYDEALDERAFSNDEFQVVRLSATTLSPSMIDYMGNWTLLEKSLANDYDDTEDATTRAELLRRSRVEANQQLAKSVLAGWDDAKVLKRQKRLAEQAVVVW